MFSNEIGGLHHEKILVPGGTGESSNKFELVVSGYFTYVDFICVIL